jgi:hypothetical protein
MAKTSSHFEKAAAYHDARMKRMLHYRERHAGWHIFNSIYWGIYIFFVGTILVLQQALHYTTTVTLGVSLIVLSLMVIIYGFVRALHGKFMKRYG